MAAEASRRKRPNEHSPTVKLASTLAANTRTALSFVGRPIYYLLSFTIIVILLVTYLIGRFSRFLCLLAFNLLKDKLKQRIAELDWSKKALSKKLTKLFKKWSSPTPYLDYLKATKKLSFKKLVSKIKKKFPRLPKIQKPRIAFHLNKKFLFSTSIAVSLISILGILFWVSILKDLPSAKELTTRQQNLSTKIYDRNGNLLYKIYKKENRTLVSLEDIPLYVRQAVVAIEDSEFYKHAGFSLRGIARSVIKNATEGELAGGSTITQQLVKNTLLSPEKTLRRKLRELVLSIQVEMVYTKDEILEMYLNEVAFGGTAYGIQEAAQTYFGKDVGELTLAEGALLAGLPRSPSRFSPFGPNPEMARRRQLDVLKAMRAHSFITEEEFKKASSEKLTFAPQKIDIKAPHFVMYVKQLLAQEFGDELVEQGGLEVITSLDLNTQLVAQEAVKREVDKLTPFHVTNGASLVTIPKTGEILSMVGSRDYFDIANDGNVNVTTSLRQPGSSIKVINYAYALSNGYTPASIIDDSPVTFYTAGSRPYTPRNYDNKFRGKITLRSALAESRNVPAVKVLASYGVENMIDLGQQMGITTWNDPSRFGLSLTLGGGEVRLVDLATVYGTLANYGKRVDLHPILQVKDRFGNILYSYECNSQQHMSPIKEVTASEYPKTTIETCQGKQVLDPRVAFLLTDILKDNNARSPAFGRFSQLVIPGRSDVAVKTGTSNNLRDNLAIGYNPDVLVAVWVGNNDNTPMSRIASGLTGATPIWNTIMKSLLAGTPEIGWSPPSGIVQTPICTITGTLACDGCPTKNEWFLAETTPKFSCNPESIAKMKEKPKEEEKQRTGGRTLEHAASIEIVN